MRCKCCAVLRFACLVSRLFLSWVCCSWSWPGPGPTQSMFDGSDRKRRVALSGRSRQVESGPEALRRLNQEREERRRASAERRAATAIQVVAGRGLPRPLGAVA